jgi:hypothetical protein
MFLAASTAPLVMPYGLPQSERFGNAGGKSIQHNPELIAFGCGNARSGARDFLLESELSLLEGLDYRIVRHRPGHLEVDLPFDTGMLELKGADVRTIH